MTRDNIVGTLQGDSRLSGGLSVGGGTTDYEELENKPSINGVELVGNMDLWQPKNFSTEEQNTGIKWIDGKDIFSKTIIIDGIYTGNGTFNLDDIPDNINIVDYNGVISYLENNIYYPVGIGNNYFAYPYINNKTIKCNISGGSSTFKYLGHLNIFYTKN